MTDQYDLFGETEAAETAAAARVEFFATPQTCPRCGLTEPSGFKMWNNHGGDLEGRTSRVVQGR